MSVNTAFITVTEISLSWLSLETPKGAISEETSRFRRKMKLTQWAKGKLLFNWGDLFDRPVDGIGGVSIYRASSISSGAKLFFVHPRWGK